MEKAERQQYLLVGAEFCWCLCLTHILPQSIHNAAKQLRAAYPSTVGVTNATIKQEWGITVGSEEFFKKALKDWLQKKYKTRQKPKSTKTNSDYQKLDGCTWNEMDKQVRGIWSLVMLLFPLTSTFLALCFTFWPHKMSSDQWTAHKFSSLGRN